MIISGKTAFVTGGASGLGQATVEMLHVAGANVVFVDLDESLGTLLEEKLGKRAKFFKADVSSENDITFAIDEALKLFGSVDIAANIAGIAIQRRITGKKGAYPLADFNRVIQVNLVGTFNVMRLAATAMTKNEPNEHSERGVIVNTSSIASYHGQPGQAAYAASKGGVNSLTLCAARDLAPMGIRVMTIAPGLFDTPIYKAVSKEIKDALLEDTVMPKRFGTAAEFADAVKSIVENPMFNGEVIRLDGAVRF